MKRQALLSLLLLGIVALMHAQTDSTKFNLYSKRGFYYFPEKGDWSVGISATPFFDYIGGLFGDKNYHVDDYYYGSRVFSATKSTPSFAFTAQNPGTIFAKYNYADNKAYRLKFLFGYSSSKDKLGSGTEESKDVYIKQTALAIGLSFGQEFYRPIKSRIRGYYGYEAGIFSTPYVGTLYQQEERSFVGKVEYVDETMPESEFTEKGGNTFGLSGSGFVGVEWFFAPKISLGGEFGLGLNMSKTRERKRESGMGDLVVDSGANDFSFVPYASGDLTIHLYF